jgi:hypothetical protein
MTKTINKDRFDFTVLSKVLKICRKISYMNALTNPTNPNFKFKIK